MTSLAWDGHTLAADKKTSCGGSAFRRTVKIHEVPGGYVACAGNVCQITKFLKWYRGGRRGKAPALEDFEAIMVVRGVATMWEGDTQLPTEKHEKLAAGSGWQWAIAAMDFGKTAVEAIEYAATRDNRSGYGIDSVTIKKAKTMANTKKTGTFKGKSNKLGHGGRAA